MEDRTILVPLDGSELAERALGPASQLARAIRARVVLLRVVAASAPEDDSTQAAAIAAAEGYLVEVANWLRPNVERVVVQVCAGSPTERILEQASLWHAELIAMATHGRGGLDRLVHGSVADTVARLSRVPVFLVPARAGRGRVISGDAVVVPVDGSPFAESALARAAELSRELVMPLHIVTAIFWEPSSLTGLAPTFDTIDEMLTGQRRYVARLVDEVRRVGVDAHGEVVIGPAARAILEYADRVNAAVVVMATHGRTALRRLTLGSVATDVLTHSRRPLLLMRPTIPGGVASRDAGQSVVA